MIKSVRSLGARQQVPFDNQAVGGRRVRTRPIFAKHHVRDALQMAARKTLDQFTVINRIQMNGSVLGAQRNNINLATLLFMLLPITSTSLYGQTNLFDGLREGSPRQTRKSGILFVREFRLEGLRGDVP